MMARHAVQLPNRQVNAPGDGVPIKRQLKRGRRMSRMDKSEASATVSKPLEEAELFMSIAQAPAKKTGPARRMKRETAESMAARQKEISVSEFFAKNRHLLGFDNPRKAL